MGAQILGALGQVSCGPVHNCVQTHLALTTRAMCDEGCRHAGKGRAVNPVKPLGIQWLSIQPSRHGKLWCKDTYHLKANVDPGLGLF